MNLRDAHCHYQFPELEPVLEETLTLAASRGVVSATVNATGESDWEAVRRVVEKRPWCRAAYGIHPWQAASRSEEWENRLVRMLEADPAASVGEIGLDTWVEGHDLPDQTRLFLAQWTVSVKLRRPASVHCVRAWEPLRQCLRKEPEHPAGFLMHAWNGPGDLIPFFAERGAYFSFSPSFLAERKRSAREAFRGIPRDRILIETDAPALAPPPKRNPFPLTDPADGGALNHPANLETAARGLAEALELTMEKTAALTSENWFRLFGR